MAYQRGDQMLLKMEVTASSGTYTTVAGLQTKTFSLASDTVEVTNADSSDKWREMLAGAGNKRLSLSARGVFAASTIEKAVKQTVLDGTIKNWQVIVPGDGTYQGAMQVTQCDFSGEHNGEVQYDWRIESAGAITYTAE